MAKYILINGILINGVTGALIYQLIIRLTDINSSSSFGVLESLLFFMLIGSLTSVFFWRRKCRESQIPERRGSGL